MAGGFVGQLRFGTIASSRAAGSVTGFGRVGGFAGYLNDSGGITQSYATGAVTQNSTTALTATQTGTGGFVGYLDISYTGTISDVYAMGAVRGTSRVGGLVGYADRGNISNAFATGHVSSSNSATSVGAVFGGLNTGFVNGNSGPLRVVSSNLYWDSTTSNQTADATGGGGVAIATAAFKNAATLALSVTSSGLVNADVLTSRRRSWRRAPSERRSPWASNARAQAAPMPELAPVMTTWRFIAAG
jgi:hypothetical protein